MNKLNSYLKKFKDKTILVIGDLAADEFITGEPERLSREAPVLILRWEDTNILPGCGANAATNIASLGGNVHLVGVIGEDTIGKDLSNKLSELGMETAGLFTSSNQPTAVKTRILAGGNQVVKQQIVRLDKLVSRPIDRDIEKKIISYVYNQIDKVDGLLLSDYGLGVFTPYVTGEIIRLSRKYNKFTAIDSRYNLLDFKGATIATPNLEEAGNAVGRNLKNQQDVEQAGEELLIKMELDYLLITQGGQGMTIFYCDGKKVHIPVANYAEVFDVTGAGDTVIGTLCLAMGAGVELLDAVNLANYAAGIVVRKSGVATVTPVELEEELSDG